MRKILLIFIFFGLITYSFYPRNILSEGNNDMNVQNDEIILHFSADNRLPYDWFADWIVFDAFVRSIYGTLTVLTPNGLFDLDHEDSLLEYIVPDKDDNKSLIFGLKKNLFFETLNEKKEFTSEDIKFSYSIPFFLKDNDIFEQSDLLKIKGMKNIRAGDIYDETKIEGIKIIDKYTLKIEFENNIDPNIVTHLSTSKYPIVSKYFYLKKSKDELSPGLGKYKVINKNISSGEILIKRKTPAKGYPNYFKFISSVDNRGDLFWRDLWENLDSNYQKKIIRIPYNTTGIFFNYKTKLGQNANFRKAISLAINRNKICENILNIIPNNQTLPNGYWGRIEVTEKYNVNLARELIKEIKDIPNPIIITVGASEFELKKSYYNELKKQLTQIGLNPIFSKKESYRPFETEMIVAGIAVPYKLPSSVFQFFVEGSSFTNAYPVDTLLRDKFDKLNSALTDVDKLRYSKELSSYIEENNIFVPIWDTLTEFVFNNKKIKSLGNQPGGMVFDLWQVQINDDN